MRHRLSIAALAASSLLPATASADSLDAGDAAYDSARAIVVIGHHAAREAEAAVAATPGGADLVGYEDYADRTVVSLRDVLAFSPGVYAQPRFGQEVRLSIRGSGLSRGFHMRGLTLLQDGVPINLADDNGDFQELEPTFFDHLEVYRGANALRFGSGTLGGAINGVTPRGDRARGLFARLDGGSFGMARALVSGGLGDERANAWIGFSADRHDGDRQHAKRRSARLHANAAFRLSDAVSTRFWVSVNAIDQELPGALSLADALGNPRKGNFFGDQQRNIRSLRVQNRTTVALGDATLELGAFLNARELYHPIFQVVDQDSTDRGGFARLEWRSGPFSATLGGEARWGTIRAKRFVNVNGKRGAPTFDADQRARTTSLYAEARVEAAAGLTLIAGAVRTEGLRRQDQVLPATVRGEAAFDAFSPRFGVLWQARPDVQVYANFSRSAELPTFVELAQVAAFVPLRAQRAWTAEVGTRGKAGAVSWDVSYYRAAVRGEMLQFTVRPDVPASTFNAESTLHQGIEAALTIEPASWLRLRQAWLWSDFRFRDDREFGDNRLPVVPRHVLRAEVRFGTDALHLSPSVEWVPQGPWADYRNTLRAPGYALVGLTAGASVAEGVDLFLDARNLADRKAVGDISAVIAATPASVIHYPVERRAVYAGVRARF